jgi:uncharacterized protein (TIGR02466 family)
MTISNSHLELAFAVPIWTAELSPITDEELEIIKNLDYIQVPGDPKKVKHTIQTYLLDNEPKLARLRQEISEAVNYYWRNILHVEEHAGIKHQHSWVTKHNPGDGNSWHQNNNALLSSIFYVQAPENSGQLIFRKDANHCNLFPNIMEMQFSNSTSYNSREYEVTPRNNLLVICPAQIEHCITTNRSDQDRYALVADWWPTGITNYGIDGGYFEHPLS